MFASLAGEVISGRIVVRDEQVYRWLVAAYLASPNELGGMFEARATETKSGFPCKLRSRENAGAVSIAD
jgi:hypothetical protein